LSGLWPIGLTPDQKYRHSKKQADFHGGQCTLLTSPEFGDCIRRNEFNVTTRAFITIRIIWQRYFLTKLDGMRLKAKFAIEAAG
jgi:hypothetical protein